MTARRRYWSIAMNQPFSWLVSCADSPSPHMTRGHVAIIRAVIRRKVTGGGA